MVYAYYGYGQGKTSCLNGLCLRLLASKQPVFFVRFFKGKPTSEDISFAKLGLKVKLLQKTKAFIWTKDLKARQQVIANAQKGIQYVLDNASSYSYIILDEALDLVTNKIMSSRQFCTFLKEISQNKYVFISGHHMDSTIKIFCDLVTFFKKEKHPFDKGLQAVKYIEF
ncbi:cob(I)yrinic acid a,c-diamide adenosyltransferase [[Mycoplasma] testudinis]|uniref:cob(I)yrinic acid a,c-diamide adenosyltransferase n=1 Tax=[Mycoplasma] testudinis TaxID=33924 RepID=UPI00048742A1|nr:cob(I)yrinic acid a,c-diamide adenosyltransferase [[Mycoplasma] testudinis]